MWRDCKFSPEVGIEVLLHRCLIKIGEDSKLWVHDSLRELGRDIVRNEKTTSGMPTRLWRSDEARAALDSKKGMVDIKAVSLQNEPDRRPYTFDSKHFRRMPNLRFLRLENTDLSGDFRFLSELRWFSWQRSSYKFTPNSLPMEKLMVLDMSQSRVTNEWRGWSSIKKAEKLKVLDLSGCHKLTKTPNLLVFPDLERLILEDCKGLGEVDGSMVDLPYLSFLSLKNCSSIKKLPNRLGSLQTLKELIIDGTAIMKLPDSIIALKNLQRLSVNDCHDLKALPNSIGRLDSLVELSLSHASIETLPDSIGDLINLEMLDISSSRISSFPGALGKLEKLKEINASRCKDLKGEFPDELGRLSSLKVLRLDGTNINGIPRTISQLSHLQTLDLTGCSRIQHVPELPVSLVTVRVTSELVEAIPNLRLLINLEELVLSSGSSRCEIGSLPRLKVLCFPSCPNLQTLPVLPISLQKLSISNSSLEMLPEFSNPESLLELSLENCNKLKEIPSLEHLKVLKSLKVSCCPLITSLTFPEGSDSLRRLQVSSCEVLAKLPDLSVFKKLSVINVRSCRSLVGLPGLGSLYVLTNLDIGQCKSIESLPGLSKLTLLRSLYADGCEKLQELEGVGALEELSSLQISGCINIKSLPDLSKLRKLSYFNIKDCKDILELRGLLKLKSLRRIVISGDVIVARLQDLVELSYSSNSTGGNNASLVSQILAECRRRSAALGGHLSAPGDPSLPSIGGLRISISRDNVLQISPCANALNVISVP